MPISTVTTLVPVLVSFNEGVARIERDPSYFTREDLMSRCRETMHSNLRYYYRFRSNRLDNGCRSSAHVPLAEKMRLVSAFGVMVRSYIRDEDVDSMYTLVNSEQFRFVRDGMRTDWADLIEDKFSGEDAKCCEDCNHVDARNNGSYCYDGDYWVCDSCCESNYRYSEGRGTYITEDDYYEEEEENERNNDDDDDDDGYPIGERHSGKDILQHIPSAFDERNPKIFLGMELEVEVNRDNDSRYDKAEELYGQLKHYTHDDGTEHQYIHIEDDGSLDYGFEMVTGWTGLDVHAQMLQFFKKPWRNVKSHDTRTCGLHVHISKGDMTMFHGCKIVFFINDSNNQKLIRDIARRSDHHYAKIHNKKASYDWLKNAKKWHGKDEQLQRLNPDRTEAVNFNNPATVEFRIFKGTLRYETQMACLEFTYATWFFCRDAGVTELTTEHFIKFICQPNQRKDTKFLRQYLREKGYSLPTLALVKPNPRMDNPPSQPIEKRA